MSTEQANKYFEMFKEPERFYRVGDRITAVKSKRPLDEAIADYKQSVVKSDTAKVAKSNERDM